MRFEYRVVSRQESLTPKAEGELLDIYGDSGWELVHVAGDTYKSYYFKRPRSPSQEELDRVSKVFSDSQMINNL